MNKVNLNHDEASQKWGKFADTAIGGLDKSLDLRMVGLVAAGATYAALQTFWHEVKHLAWPGSYGQSPWETAAFLAAALEARSLGTQFRVVGRQHVDAFDKALEGRSAKILAWKKKPLKGAIQCIDRVSGKTGCYLHRGDLHAISPVFPDLTGLFAYMRQQNLRIVPGTPFDVEEVASNKSRNRLACTG